MEQIPVPLPKKREGSLCKGFKATGKDENGGYAEYGVIPGRFAFPIPDVFSVYFFLDLLFQFGIFQ